MTDFRNTDFKMATPVVLIDPATGMADTGAGHPALGAPSNVDSSATVVPLFTVDEATKKLLIYNDSTAVLMVGFWADTSATKFSFAIQPNTGELLETNELPLGVIYGIWAAANGSARITEFS
jgi:hypothetical protein